MLKSTLWLLCMVGFTQYSFAEVMSGPSDVLGDYDPNVDYGKEYGGGEYDEDDDFGPEHDGELQDDDQNDTHDSENQTSGNSGSGESTTSIASEPIDSMDVQGGDANIVTQAGDFDEDEESIDASSLTLQQKTALESVTKKFETINNDIMDLQEQLEQESNLGSALKIRQQIKALEQEARQTGQKQQALMEMIAEPNLQKQMDRQQEIVVKNIQELNTQLTIDVVEATPTWQAKIKNMMQSAKEYVKSLFVGSQKIESAKISNLQSNAKIITNALTKACIDPAACEPLLNQYAQTIADIQGVLKQDIATVQKYQSGSNPTVLDGALKRIRTFREADTLNLFCKGLNCSLKNVSLSPANQQIAGIK